MTPLTITLLATIAFLTVTALLVRRMLTAQRLRDRVEARRLNLLPSDWDDYPPIS